MTTNPTFRSLAAALVLLAAAPAAWAVPPTCNLAVSPVTFGCVKDSQGRPIYTWQLKASDTLSCNSGGTLQVQPPTAALPNTFSIATPGTTPIALATFGATSLSFVLTGCGQACEARTPLPLPTNCGQCMSLWALEPPRCLGSAGGLCRYEIKLNLTNSTDVPGVAQFHVPGGTVSPATLNVAPGTNPVSLTLTAPCGQAAALTATLSLGGLGAPQVCQASIALPLPACAPPACMLQASPQTFGCVKDSQGQPIYSWKLNVTDTLVCSPNGTLQVTPGALPASFTVATPGSTAIALATFAGTTSLNFALSGCGQSCTWQAPLQLPTNCGTCMSVGALQKPVCLGFGDGTCSYTIKFNLTNSTDVPGVAQFQFPGGSVSPATVNVVPGSNPISVTLTAPCGGPGVLSAQLSLGGAGAPQVCAARLAIDLPECGTCKAVAKAKDAKLCAPDSTEIDLLPTVPAGSITWSASTNCAPPSPPWLALSGGTSWYTLGLSQTTCYQAAISGVPGCLSPIQSNVATVDVVQPISPGPLQCTLASGGACPPKMCSPANFSLHANTAPGCTLQWKRNGQNVGVTSAVYTPGPLPTSQCPKIPEQFQAELTCPPCAARTASAAFEIFRPSLAGQLTAAKPTICAGDDDVVTLTGQCGDSFQWQSRTGSGPYTNIPGALGPTTWLTNKLVQDTWYRVEVKNGPCAAALTNPVKITVKPKPKVTVSAAGPTEVCAPGSVVLTANATPSGGTHQWFRDGLPITGGATLTATQSGNYWVVYTTGCGKATSNKVKVLVSKVVAAISGPCGACPPACISLQGLAAGGKAPYSYLWSPGGSTAATLPSCPVAPTTYTLNVKDALGCTAAAIHKVNICPKFKANAGQNRTIPQGTSTTLGGSPTAAGGAVPYTYSWTPVSGLSNPKVANPVAKPAATTTYTVTVTDAKGCKATAQVAVKVQ